MKRIFFILLLIGAPFIGFSQEESKPTIMIVPDDDWCTKNNYMITIDNQGITDRYPDYMRALQENSELLGVISKINGIFIERGFPLSDLKGQLDKLKLDKARNNVQGVQQNPIQALNQTAKADIVIKLSWTVNTYGPKRSITFRLAGIDPYTTKQVAEAGDTGPQSFTAELPILLQEAVYAHLDKFCGDLIGHFQNIRENGREGSITLLVGQNSSTNFETVFTFKDKQAKLKDIITRYWMPRNTVKQAFMPTQNSETQLTFVNVRIPLFGDDGWGGQMIYDFNAWGGTLEQFLRDELKINSLVQVKGLGEVELILQ